MAKLIIKKTNVEYLRELIKGNDEANEWLDAIKDEMDELADEKRFAQGEVNDKENEITHLREEAELSDKLECGIGIIKYEADNIQLQGLMEVLEEKIKKYTPLKIENILAAL